LTFIDEIPTCFGTLALRKPLPDRQNTPTYAVASLKDGHTGLLSLQLSSCGQTG
jgi:hypothetical protein